MQRPPVIETTAQKRLQKTDTIFVFACCDFIAPCLDLTRFRDLIQSFPDLLLVLVIVAETYKFTPCNICPDSDTHIPGNNSLVQIADEFLPAVQTNPGIPP